MAALTSSICATLFATVPASNSGGNRIALKSSTACSLTFNPLKTSRNSTVAFAAPEALNVDEVPETIEVGSGEAASFLPMSIGDADKAGPKQQIRIELRSYWVPLIEDSCKQILDAAKITNAKTMGPVPLRLRSAFTVFSSHLTCTKMPGSTLKSEPTSTSLIFFTQRRKPLTH